MVGHTSHHLHINVDGEQKEISQLSADKTRSLVGVPINLISQTLVIFLFSLVMRRQEDCGNILDTIGTLNGILGSHIY